MILITQLIYVQPGQEAVFEEFESMAMPLIPKYNGKILLRVRPPEAAYIESAIEPPYEIHLVEFSSENDLVNFMNDETRKAFLHLKEQSVRASLLIKGAKW